MSNEPLLPLYHTNNLRRQLMSSNKMQELEPSPVDESPPAMPTNPDDPAVASSKEYFPATRASTTNTLGAHTSRTPRILLMIQKLSTIPPTLYLLMHYTNTALIPATTWSLQKAENSLLLTRPYYQPFPLEPLLIFFPVAAHALSGLTLRLYRRRQAAKRYGADTHAERRQITKTLWPKLSLTSALGYTFIPLVVGHVMTNRIIPKKIHGDSSAVGLRFFSYSLQRHPWTASLGYAAMIAIACWHIAGGAAKYLKLTPEYVTKGGEEGARQKAKRSRVINLIAGAVTAVWVVGGLGVVGRGVGAASPSAWEIKNWDQVIRAVPVIGPYM